MNNAQAEKRDKAEQREEEEQAQSRGRVGFIVPSRITGTLHYWPPKLVFFCSGKYLWTHEGTTEQMKSCSSCTCVMSWHKHHDDRLWEHIWVFAPQLERFTARLRKSTFSALSLSVHPSMAFLFISTLSLSLSLSFISWTLNGFSPPLGKLLKDNNMPLLTSLLCQLFFPRVIND